MSWSGPYSRTFDVPGQVYFSRQDVYKTVGWPKATKRPLPYLHTFVEGKGYWGSLGVHNAMSELTLRDDSMYAIAYDRFHSKALERASLGVSCAQGGQALEMIVKRTSQLRSAIRALRRNDFDSLSKALELDSKKHYRRQNRERKYGVKVEKSPRELFQRSATKSLSDTWLEFTFGWVPLVDDIGAAVEVLQQEFSPDEFVTGSSYDLSFINSSDDSQLRLLRNEYSCRVRGRVQVTNPNLLLANQLGFINPAEVIWDAIPFSFVVDWFLPVGKFLKSFTNEVGYTVVDRSVSFRARSVGRVRHVADNENVPYNARGFTLMRSVPSSFPRPDLIHRAKVPNLNPWLAATSTSLVVQQLTGLVSDWRRINPR